MASEEQWMVLLDHIQTDEELLTGRFLQPNGAIRVPQKWNELATVLNSVKPGTQKSGNEWKSAWANLRSRARTAYREKVRYMAGTGGGPAPEIVGLGLNRVYERVIDLTGTTAAVGTKCPNPLQVNAAYEAVPRPPPQRVNHRGPIQPFSASRQSLPPAAVCSGIVLQSPNSSREHCAEPTQASTRRSIKLSVKQTNRGSITSCGSVQPAGKNVPEQPVDIDKTIADFITLLDMKTAIMMSAMSESCH